MRCRTVASSASLKGPRFRCIQRRPEVYLELALLALRKIPNFSRDAQSILISLMTFVIAGDALGRLRKLAPDLRARVPDGDLIVSFRNVLAHGYAMLDQRKVFEVATSGAPDLLQTLEALLEEFPE